MLDRLLTPSPDTPLWLYGLRLAARVADYVLLAFALFALFSVANAEPLTVAFLTLIVAFALVNLRAITLSRMPHGAGAGLKYTAHLLSAALPLAYLGGVWFFADAAVTLRQAIAVTAPPLLNWLAIEQTEAARRAPRGAA